MTKPIVFLDGQLLRADKKLLLRLNPWRLSGRGVFETMRAQGGRVLFFGEHWRRLKNSLKVLRLNNPYPQRALAQLLESLLMLNQYPQTRLRLTVWRDRQMHLCIVALPIEQLKRQEFRVGLHLKKMKALPPAQRIKSIDYQFFFDAYHVAQRRGFDEAVILNQRNEVAEASRSNIFIVKNGCLLTPCLGSGGLPGVTRKIILQLARQKKMKMKEGCLSLQDLQAAEEIFLTNSVQGIVPVVALDNQRIARGRCGPWTKRLQAAYKGRADV